MKLSALRREDMPKVSAGIKNADNAQAVRNLLIVDVHVLEAWDLPRSHGSKFGMREGLQRSHTRHVQEVFTSLLNRVRKSFRHGVRPLCQKVTHITQYIGAGYRTDNQGTSRHRFRP